MNEPRKETVTHVPDGSRLGLAERCATLSLGGETPTATPAEHPLATRELTALAAELVYEWRKLPTSRPTADDHRIVLWVLDRISTLVDLRRADPGFSWTAGGR